MSAHDHTHTAHGHDGHAAAAHTGHHHVTPASTFLTVLIALLILTFVTVAASRVDFGAANLLIAMLIASVKAGLVIAIFMHVKWDTAINRIVFLSSFLFLSLLFTFTLADQATRGRANPTNKVRATVQYQWVHPTQLPGSKQ